MAGRWHIRYLKNGEWTYSLDHRSRRDAIATAEIEDAVTWEIVAHTVDAAESVWTATPDLPTRNVR